MTLRARSIHNPEERSTRLRIDRLKGIKNDLIFLSSLACARCSNLPPLGRKRVVVFVTSFLRRVRRNAPQQEVCIFHNELFSFRRIRDEAWRDSQAKIRFPACVFIFPSIFFALTRARIKLFALLLYSAVFACIAL